jgi:hypothetical protein
MTLTGETKVGLVGEKPVPLHVVHHRPQASPCGICGVQSATGTDFSFSTPIFRCQ